LKVNVEEPVLEELMGGCSLRCAFRWSVEVIGEGGKPKPVKTLNDESAQTAWIADPPPRKSGIGMKLRLVFPKKLPKELEGATPIYGLDLINGHWKTEELWKQHGRIRKARLFYNERPLGDITFADSRRWQRVIIPDMFVNSGDSMTLEILEIYPGEGAGTAVSVTSSPNGYVATQVVPQSIPAGADTTSPMPTPSRVTVRTIAPASAGGVPSLAGAASVAGASTFVAGASTGMALPWARACCVEIEIHRESTYWSSRPYRANGDA